MSEIAYCDRHGPSMSIPYVEECPMCSAQAALRAVRDALREFYRETESAFFALEDVLALFVEKGGRFEVKEEGEGRVG